MVLRSVLRSSDTVIRRVGKKKEEVESRLLIIQYGNARTATTLQYEALCGAACLVFGATEEIDCKYGDFIPMSKPFEKPTVLKLHSRKKLLEVLQLYKKTTDRVWLFATAREDPKEGFNFQASRREEELRNEFNVSFVQIQLFESLGRRGFYVVRDLMDSPLNLNESQADALTEFTRYWEILRRCCGAQMSHDYRMRLIGVNASSLNGEHRRKVHRSYDHLQYDACEMYNVSVVENHLRRTSLFKTCSSLDAIERLSVVDGRLNGSYCNRANALTAHESLQFNDPMYLSELDPEVQIDAYYQRIYPAKSSKIHQADTEDSLIISHTAHFSLALFVSVFGFIATWFLSKLAWTVLSTFFFGRSVGSRRLRRGND